MQRGHVTWTAVGTLSVIGSFWLTMRLFQVAELADEWVPFAAHFIGALFAGAVIVTHATLRPLREPLIAGVAAVVVLMLLFLAMPSPMFGWAPTRSASPGLLALALACVSGVGATCGAALARRFTTTAPNTIKIVLLSTMLVTGLVNTVIQIAIGAGVDMRGQSWFGLASLLVVVLGGFLTQRMVVVYRPWACGAGLTLFATTLYLDKSIVDALYALVGSLVIGAIGARLARRWVVQADVAPLPAARMH